ncbi:hypothetical protein JCM10207_007846 [Rhodosporidiobolus poonsookiae]
MCPARRPPAPIYRMPKTAQTTTAAQIVRQTLRELGPSTTQALHAHLHRPAAPPLPAQQLLFPTAHLTSISPRQRRHMPPEELRPPGEGDGWSVKYLKTRVLGGMEEMGQVRKVTRARWEAAAGLSGGGGAAEAPGTRAGAGQEGAGDEGGETSAAPSSSSKKDSQEHLWVLADVWARATRRPRTEGEVQAQRTAGDARRRAAERELRREYGLE